ncbi:MAG: hypothetical protein V1914_03895 [archaeon]
MKQTDNKIKWCLKKAKKELAQSRKHRGLIKIEPDIEEAKKHIIKAEHNALAIITAEKARLTDWSVNAAFYTIYHCFLAIITKFGYESRNQECTIALIKKLKEENKIKLDKDIITAFEPEEHETSQESNIIQMRENFQYGTETSIEDQKLKTLKELCRRTIEQTKREVYR